MLRIALFLATNVAVLIVASIIMRLFGLDQMMSGGLGPALIYAAIFGMSGAFISLLMSKSMAKRSTGCRVIEQPRNSTEQWLMDTTARIAQDAGIGMPEVAIFPSPQPNAFATGWRRDDSLMAVSEGLLNHMEPNEVEAVIGHEIGHIANGDMVTLTLVQGVLNTFVIFFARIIGQAVDRAVFRGNGYGMGYFLSYMAAQFALGILASAIVMWFSRYREFRADDAGARLTGRENMIAALERLKGPSSQESDMPETLVAFGISGESVRKLFTSHPPLDERIAALRAAA